MKKTESMCAPKIWKKLSSMQREWWVGLYKAFLVPENYPPYMCGKGQKDKMMRKVIAHNMACQAVWYLDGDKT